MIHIKSKQILYNKATAANINILFSCHHKKKDKYSPDVWNIAKWIVRIKYGYKRDELLIVVHRTIAHFHPTF